MKSTRHCCCSCICGVTEPSSSLDTFLVALNWDVAEPGGTWEVICLVFTATMIPQSFIYLFLSIIEFNSGIASEECTQCRGKYSHNTPGYHNISLWLSRCPTAPPDQVHADT